MSDRPKLPRSVVILNIIMIVLILVICGLAFSLAISQTGSGQEDTTASASASAVTAEQSEQSDQTEAAQTTTTPVTTTSLVEMTKRTLQQTEPIEIPDEPTQEASPVTEEPDSSYNKGVFAEDLFIGDSITTGLHIYGKLDIRNVAASVGYTPYKAYTDVVDLYDGTQATALEYAESMQPKRIFIMLGANGLAGASAMEDSYRTLVDKLKAACPDSELYCLAVSPVTADSSAAASAGITIDMVVEFNAIVKEICSDKGVGFIDMYSLLSNDDGYFIEDYAEVDGMHFKGKTYDIMLAYIENNIT